MKRKRKSWVEVTNFAQGIMYETATRKWKEYDDIQSCSSSHAQFKTLNRARRNAQALHTRLGCKVILLHWTYRKGRRVCREWFIKAKGATNAAICS